VERIDRVYPTIPVPCTTVICATDVCTECNIFIDLLVRRPQFSLIYQREQRTIMSLEHLSE
jgi:hypothetical protein